MNKMEFFKILEEGLIDFLLMNYKKFYMTIKNIFPMHNLMGKQKKK